MMSALTIFFSGDSRRNNSGKKRGEEKEEKGTGYFITPTLGRNRDRYVYSQLIISETTFVPHIP